MIRISTEEILWYVFATIVVEILVKKNSIYQKCNGTGKGMHYASLGNEPFVSNTGVSVEWRSIGVESISTHAEMNAIIQFLKKKNADKGRRKRRFENNIKMPKKIKVVLLYRGRFKYSRPCNDCIKVLRYYGIQKVTYSTGDPSNRFITENIQEMPMLYTSVGNIY